MVQPLLLQRLNHPELVARNIRCSVWREDLNHPVISGNKWHKLAPWLALAAEQNKRGLMSFGGRHSNHLHALAYAGHHCGFTTKGWVRGHPAEGMSPTLADCLRWGMEVIFVSRARYRQRHGPEWRRCAEQQWPDFVFIPEGGTSPIAVEAVRQWGLELWGKLPSGTTLLVPVGSGGTYAGLALSAPSVQRIIAVPVFKQPEATLRSLQHHYDLPGGQCWPAAGRGFGRNSAEEIAFGRFFQTHFGVPLEPVYNLKVAYVFWQRLMRNELPTGSQWVLLHTGGLQGRRGTELSAS
ncbi:1-aminocyclopropane-1-carboxylate deaminase/D-cysteine desulfhydrase [Salinispirillum marinum]|uniref:1-aminocyclopropane-1-carboxylate deaminase/D-cysteine desulfhydrase n=2 Tax=Saccharospirillaceae TaxID=255527 RepID=A0ABV8BCN9_9GAMM